jgi:predicted lactoylglutathione lyase
MVFSDTIHAMLMTHDKYRRFTTKKIADAKTTSQGLICKSADSRTKVNDLVSKAASAGGVIDPSPQDDYDFMYGRRFRGSRWPSLGRELDGFRGSRQGYGCSSGVI